jgi:hypothetical protein
MENHLTDAFLILNYTPLYNFSCLAALQEVTPKARPPPCPRFRCLSSTAETEENHGKHQQKNKTKKS